MKIPNPFIFMMWIKNIAWIITIVILFILLLYNVKTRFFNSGKEYSFNSTIPELVAIQKIEDLHIDRMIVSLRKQLYFSPSGHYYFNEMPNSKLLDFVGVGTVDVIIPLKMVKFDVSNKSICVHIKNILVPKAILDSGASFVWKNEVTNVPDYLSKAQEIVKGLCSAQALKEGILESAKENATHFFKSWFSRSGYQNIDVIFEK